MHFHFWEQVDYDNTCHNQRDADIGWQVGHLLEHENADERYKHNAEGTPNGVCDADGHGAQGMAQAIEREHIAYNHCGGGQQLSKLLGVFEHRGGKRLKDDGTNQKQPFFHKLKFT